MIALIKNSSEIGNLNDQNIYFKNILQVSLL